MRHYAVNQPLLLTTAAPFFTSVSKERSSSSSFRSLKEERRSAAVWRGTFKDFEAHRLAVEE